MPSLSNSKKVEDIEKIKKIAAQLRIYLKELDTLHLWVAGAYLAFAIHEITQCLPTSLLLDPELDTSSSFSLDD